MEEQSPEGDGEAAEGEPEPKRQRSSTLSVVKPQKVVSWKDEEAEDRARSDASGLAVADDGSPGKSKPQDARRAQNVTRHVLRSDADGLAITDDGSEEIIDVTMDLDVAEVGGACYSSVDVPMASAHYLPILGSDSLRANLTFSNETFGARFGHPAGLNVGLAMSRHTSLAANVMSGRSAAM